jgi:hypothetical protein
VAYRLIVPTRAARPRSRGAPIAGAELLAADAVREDVDAGRRVPSGGSPSWDGGAALGAVSPGRTKDQLRAV